MSSVSFYNVNLMSGDGLGIARRNNVSGVPHTAFYSRSRKLGDMRGDSADEFRKLLVKYKVRSTELLFPCLGLFLVIVLILVLVIGPSRFLFFVVCLALFLVLVLFPCLVLFLFLSLFIFLSRPLPLFFVFGSVVFHSVARAG